MTEEEIEMLRGSCGMYPRIGQREIYMKYLYESGMTLQGIGELFGVTRERIRQIMSNRFNTSRRNKPEKNLIPPPTYKEKIRTKLLQNMRVKSDTDCWEWTRGKIPTGYGTMSYGGIKQYAHRVAYEIFTGEKLKNSGRNTAETICVLHRCHNPACINPEHLYLGDQRRNAYDRAHPLENLIYIG